MWCKDEDDVHDEMEVGDQVVVSHSGCESVSQRDKRVSFLYSAISENRDLTQ